MTDGPRADGDLNPAMRPRSRDLRTQQTEWAKAKTFLDKLKANPEDAEAALAVGKYYAASRGNWEHALPLFAKSTQAALEQARK